MLRGIIGGLLNTVDMAEPNIDSKSLKEKIIASENPIVQHNFGIILGSIYFIKPGPFIDFDKIFTDVLDHKQQSNPQRTRSAQAWMVNGPIITSRSGEDALRHHRLFIRSMSRSDRYTELTINALNNLNISDGQAITFRTLTTLTIYNILANGMFDMDALPVDIAIALQQFSSITSGEDASNETGEDKNDTPVIDAMSDFAKNCFNILRGTYYPNLLRGLPEFTKARATYTAAARQLIKDQKDNIKANIMHFTNGNDTTNILALSVIEIFKEELKDTKIERNKLNQCIKHMLEDDAHFDKLLNNDYIYTLPAVLMAALNLRGVIPSMLHALASNPDLLASLRDYLEEKNLKADFSNLHDFINEDKKGNGKLNQIYLEGLRLRGFNDPLEELQFSNLFRYYIDKPLAVGNTIIPADSVICILNGMNLVDDKMWGNQPEKFNSNRFFGAPDAIKPKLKIASSAFSHAPRVCPGHNIAEYISKTFVAYLAMKFNFDIVARPNESSITKAKLKFTKRNLEAELDLVGDEQEVKKFCV